MRMHGKVRDQIYKNDWHLNEKYEVLIYKKNIGTPAPPPLSPKTKTIIVWLCINSSAELTTPMKYISSLANLKI